MASRPFRFVDLFAGIGGFHAALAGMGGECVYAVDSDRNAADIYRLNWGVSALGDIQTDVNDSTMLVPSHDILCAGFPCQPFSKSGYQLGMEETRGTLYWNILQVVRSQKPAAVLLENVRNLAGPRHAHELEIIIKTLRDEGYRVSSRPTVFSPHLLPPNMGGRPQIRERVFIVAVRRRTNSSDHTTAPQPLFENKPVQAWDPENWNLERDLLLDLDDESTGTELSANEEYWIDTWDDFVRRIRRSSNGARLPGFPLWADHWIHSAKLRIPKGTPVWKANFLQKNADFYTANRRLIDTWSSRWDLYSDRFPPSRRKLEWQAGDTDSLWRSFMHFRPSGIRVKSPNYFPALVAINQTSIIGSRRRRLSPREAARLQGFPEWFNFGDQSAAATYRQLGNSVNIGVVWNVLKRMAETEEHELRYSAPGLLRSIKKSPQNPDIALEGLVA